MSLLVFVPFLICLFFVVRGRVEAALLSVYLPVLLLVPESYAVRLPHLPTISTSEAAVIPLGFLAIYRLILKGMPSILDILMVVFMVSVSTSEVLKETVRNDGIFVAMTQFWSIFLPYVVGRALIEPGLRVTAVKRFVFLILLLGFPGLVEWRMGQNLYGTFGSKIFGAMEHTGIQMRGGHGRMAAAFTDAEIGGIAFVMTACLNAWLFYIWKRRLWKDPGKLFNILEKYHLGGILLLGYVYLTQSRGPMLAAALAYLILQIPRFKNTKLATVVVAIIIASGTIALLRYYARYADVEDVYSVSEQQASAAYRFQMNKLYTPIAEEGGALGWGSLSIPAIPSMHSIDNQFLLTHLSHGESGYILLILISLESMRSLVVRSWRMKNIEDRAFAISMLAAMAALWFSLTTVYMGEQLPQVAFFLIGWSQSLQAGAITSAGAVEETAPSKFAFSRVFR